nr:flippase [uncultured Blautia sp.]
MKTHSIKFNFIMNAILTVSSIIFPLITAPYIFRTLGPVGSGRVDSAAAIITYFMMFASLGIPTYGIRTCAKVRDDKEKLSQTVQELMIINGVSMLLPFTVFLIMLAVVPEFTQERTLLLINSISMVLNVVGVTWFYNAIEQYAYITTCSIVFKIISILMMFLWVKNPEDYIKYGAITVFAGSASYLLNFWNLRKYVSFRKIGRYNFKQHMKPIMVFFATTAAISVYTNLDIVMIRFMKGNAEVGYYTAAIKVKTLLVSLITSLGTVLLPRLSYYIEKGEQEAFHRMVVKAFNFVLLVGLSVTMYFIFMAKESILLLAGEQFAASILPMQILMPAVLFIGLSNITGIQILTPQGEEKKVVYSIVFGAVLDFILNLVLIGKHGASGAAFATLMAELVVLVVQCVYLRKMLGNLVKKISIRENVLAAVMASGGLFLVRQVLTNGTSTVWVFVNLVITAVVFFGVYGMMLLVQKEKFAMEMVEMGLRLLRRKE